jgi:hypothetical protein
MIAIEWAPGPAGDVPKSVVALDPQYLHPLKSSDVLDTYLYESEVGASG